jgi:rSAM/selenodomain-associated transferase 1
MNNKAPQRIVGLFAKEPREGQVKTRLAEATSNAIAARIATAFLSDSIERLAVIKAHLVLAYAPITSHEFFSKAVAGRFDLVPQAEGDLGTRMALFFGRQFAEGAGRVVLVGADSPTLPLDFVEKAFSVLEISDLVIGPATDGGYYLIGCTRFIPELFGDISWSSSTVLRDTLRKSRDLGLRFSLLPPWYDVDTLDDWRMLQGHVLAMRQAGFEPNIPATEMILEELTDL